MRRRRSSSTGKNDPERSLEIFTDTSPAGVDTELVRWPLRWVERSAERT